MKRVIKDIETAVDSKQLINAQKLVSEVSEDMMESSVACRRH